MKDWLKGHIEWVYAAACMGAAAYSFSLGDATGGWVCVGIAVGIVVVLRVLLRVAKRVESYDVTTREFDLDIARKGVEPVPIPGENPFSPDHSPENCELCQALKKRGIIE